MLHVTSEYGRLETVMVGSPDVLPPLIPINSTQKYYYSTNPPRLDIMREEHEHFVNVLQDNGVNVLWADDIPNCDQRDIRDVGFVILDNFFICRLKEKIRQDEISGLDSLLKKIPQEKVYLLHEGFLEGGDVMIDQNVMIIGTGVRTDVLGASFLKGVFENILDSFVVALEGEMALHLDTVFNIVDKELALIYLDAFSKQAIKMLESRYELMPISQDEQFNLATNVLALGDRRIILDYSRNSRVADNLSSRGCSVFDVKFSETNKIGGSFRCATLPLFREN